MSHCAAGVIPEVHAHSSHSGHRTAALACQEVLFRSGWIELLHVHERTMRGHWCPIMDYDVQSDYCGSPWARAAAGLLKQTTQHSRGIAGGLLPVLLAAFALSLMAGIRYI